MLHKQVAWAHSEHGCVIACGSEDGLVTIWQQAQKTRGPDERWMQRATLTDSLKPITCLTFAPVQLGPQLAVASDDGFVRFYEASAALNADTWRLCNDFLVWFFTATLHTHHCRGALAQRIHAFACMQASSSGGCKSLSWRPHTYGLPPMLCVGTTEAATVWYHR